ncbi:biopolymer transporter ExbD [Pedobacter frigoris]|uniref:ExbD/TolR family protein n=1 Tax=Pedobacter frigoris TaxID=2571272 RepID=UPI00292F14E7|nr:biopolymer transporter ExbD [Pedobacter frigoris]
MPRAKVQRKSTSIDMTAMCDVSFLLLTFFILTATARQPDPLNISIPASTYKIKVPDKDLAILSIGQGKVFYEIVGNDIKAATLDKIGEQYKIKFTPEERKRFSVLGSFGVPVQNLKQFIMMDGEQRDKFAKQLQGIPADTTGNSELDQWILQNRKAVAELHNNEPLRISIKGDANEEYPTVKKIMDVLQNQKMNKFSLITSAEGGK